MSIRTKAIRGAIAAAAVVFLTSRACAGSAEALVDVDVELVLAADRSASMSRLMLVRQRNGFAASFQSNDLRKMVQSGLLGRIAVVYVEWSDATDQEVMVPWTLLESDEDFERFAGAINAIEIASPSRETAIGAALLHAQDLLDTNKYVGKRQVIDLSGNGRNSDGPPVHVALQELNSVSTTVNALVLPQEDFQLGIDLSVVDYFWQEVVSGPGGFAIAVGPDMSFLEAIHRKLTLELAWIAE